MEAGRAAGAVGQGAGGTGLGPGLGLGVCREGGRVRLWGRKEGVVLCGELLLRRGSLLLPLLVLVLLHFERPRPCLRRWWLQPLLVLLHVLAVVFLVVARLLLPMLAAAAYAAAVVRALLLDLLLPVLLVPAPALSLALAPPVQHSLAVLQSASAASGADPRASSAAACGPPPLLGLQAVGGRVRRAGPAATVDP